jgi:hypothetical protein
MFKISMYGVLLIKFLSMFKISMYDVLLMATLNLFKISKVCAYYKY